MFFFLRLLSKMLFFTLEEVSKSLTRTRRRLIINLLICIQSISISFRSSGPLPIQLLNIARRMG